MIYLDINPSMVRIQADSDEDMVQANLVLLDQLKSKNPQAHMINERLTKWGTPVPYYHIAFDTETQSFPRGLLNRAVRALQKEGLNFQVLTVDQGLLRTPDSPIILPALAARDYQVEAVQAWAQAEQGIIVIPTRGGKTFIGGLATSMLIQDMPVLWLTTKLEAQADVVDAWNDQWGGLAPAYTTCEDHGLSVLTYTTATKRDLSHFGFVIADEVHRAAADTYYEAIQSATQAWYRLGLTGTPKGRSDGKEIFIEGAVGEVCYQIERRLLIERGICSSGKTWRVPFKVTQHIEGGVGNWTEIEKHGLVENKERDRLLIKAALDARVVLNDPEAQILVLCRRQAHAEGMAEALSELLGIDVPAMHSKISKRKRLAIYKKLASGELTCAVGTGIYDDSMTFPHLKIIVIAAGGKSTILTGQRMGRVLAGCKEIIIIDCEDAHYETLRRHAKRRFRIYEAEGYPVEDWTEGSV